jgi:exopolyphosphatase/guanosine-5'-triphosphate,3'-diphosphate pyrophosphatase
MVMIFAAIDIGSNAVRLLFSNVFEGEEEGEIIRKESLIRVPIRLGEDAFTIGHISEGKIEALVKTMGAFRSLMEVHCPLDYLACATSALREAANGPEITDRIRREAGIEVEIIDGHREAEIIYSNHIAESLSREGSCLYIEVGGGSTELTLFSRDTMIVSRTFAVGTVRILNDRMEKAEWNRLREWVRAHTADYRPLTGIGTGGNINFLFRMSGKKEGKPLGYKEIKRLGKLLRSYSLEDRVKVLGLRPDRADVIIPALDIYLSVMKWAGITDIIVPNIGLADGIIHLLAEKHRTLAEQGITPERRIPCIPME